MSSEGDAGQRRFPFVLRPGSGLSASWRIAGFSALFFSGCFALVSLLFHFGDWPRLLRVALIGVCVGLAASPSIEPRAFRHAWPFEVIPIALLGTLLGWALGGGIEGIALGTLIGAMLGFLAPWWLKHLRIP